MAQDIVSVPGPYAHYPALAQLFDFPDSEYLTRLVRLQTLLAEPYPQAASELTSFIASLPDSENALQELYTRTFEIQSLTTLSIGYILFGDDYKRGDLLANLNREHGVAGNDCRGELADHLPNVLRLLPRIEDEELRLELASELLLPAVTMMEAEFEPTRVARKDKNYEKHYKTLIEVPVANKTVYGRAFSVLLDVLKRDFPTPAQDAACDMVARRSSDFLGMIEKEMEIEA